MSLAQPVVGNALVQEVTSRQFFAKLCAWPFVETIRVFGSRARGDAALRADIDLAIECPTATIVDWTNLERALDHKDTLLRVDCVRLDQLSVADPLRLSIEQESILVYSRAAK